MEKIEQMELNIQGMTCDSCALHVESALKEVPGVREVVVPGWMTGRATVTVEETVDSQALVESVRKAGYSASVKTGKSMIERTVERTGLTPERSGDDFDLMVIGAGSAGFAAAIKAAELGYRTAMVEAGTIGGTCVNEGCVPSKTLILAMEQYHQAAKSRFQGVETIAGRLYWPVVIDHKDRLVEEMRQSKYINVLKAYPEIALIGGYARLTGSNTVEVDGKAYTAGKILIATGAQPWTPPIAGLTEAGYLTSTTAMDLQELPHSIVVMGASAVGLEMAQIFARAGAFVRLLEVLPRIAPFEDKEISASLHSYLEGEGIQIVTGFQVKQVEKSDGRYIITGSQDDQEMIFESEQLLVAAGRRANTAGIGLEEVGARLGERGEILVDENLRTENPNIYAAGDVIGQDMFVYVAAYGGTLAAENALLDAGRVFDASYIPRITFTDPQIASAGLTEEQAREQGYTIKVSTLPMSFVPRALAARDTRGLIKLVVDTNTDHLLGAHILAPEGGEMIQTAVLAIRFGITLTQLLDTVFPYLTNVEGIKLAAVAFEKDVALLSCCAG